MPRAAAVTADGSLQPRRAPKARLVQIQREVLRLQGNSSIVMYFGSCSTRTLWSLMLTMTKLFN